VTHSDQLDQIAAALAKAQGEIQNVVKDAKNPHFKSDYATLDAVTDTVRPIFARNGLAIVQLPTSENGIATVHTLITHSSGQWIKGDTSCPLSKADAQGLGSATTYLRRYATSAAANIAQTDDDGNAASQPTNGRQTAAPQKPSAPAGYAEWFAKLTAAAPKGTDELKKVYGLEGAKTFRAYLAATNNNSWEDLKTVAADADQKEPAHA
jgi:hypothetical protein